MKIKIMDYAGDLEEVELPDNVSQIIVSVVSGDEILTFQTEDGGGGRIAHSSQDKCVCGFFDGRYEILNKNTGLDRIEEWKNRYDTYEYI